MAPTPEPPKVYDIIIIGAGPVGLAAAAAAIHRSATRVLVLDQTRAFRPAGSRVDLQANALRACHIIHPQVIPYLAPFETDSSSFPVGWVNVDGEPIAGATRKSDPTVRKRHNLRWSEIQDVFRKVLSESPCDVRVNHHLVDLQEEVLRTGDDGKEHVVRVDSVRNKERPNLYENWSDIKQYAAAIESGGPAERVSFYGRLVIGADGIHSQVRQCIYRECGFGDFSAPEYTGLYRIIGSVPVADIDQTDDDLLCEQYMQGLSFSVVTRRQTEVSYDSIRVIFVRTSSPVGNMWTLIAYAACEKSIILTSSREHMIRLAQEQMREAGMLDAAIRLSRAAWMENGKARSTTDVRPFYIIPVDEPTPFERLTHAHRPDYPDEFYRPWWNGRVVLVGDSLHGNPPFLGQGAGLGLEDVSELMTLLDEIGALREESAKHVSNDAVHESFAEYKTRRLERNQFAQRITMNRCSEYDEDQMASDLNILHRWNGREK